jgi:hypothetical protein
LPTLCSLLFGLFLLWRFSRWWKPHYKNPINIPRLKLHYSSFLFVSIPHLKCGFCISDFAWVASYKFLVKIGNSQYRRHHWLLR